MNTVIKTIESTIATEKSNIKYHHEKRDTESAYHNNAIKKSEETIEKLESELNQLKDKFGIVTETEE